MFNEGLQSSWIVIDLKNVEILCLKVKNQPQKAGFLWARSAEISKISNIFHHEILNYSARAALFFDKPIVAYLATTRTISRHLLE